MDDINRVARLMVDAEPAADLEGRVRARLDESPAAPVRRAWRTWQVAGVAAALTLAAVWSWGPEVQRSGSPEVLESAGVLGSGGLASPKPEAKAGPALLGSGLAVRHSTGGGRAQVHVTHALSAEELAWMDRRIPALDPVVALEMDQLAMESIQPEPLAITPLIMTALPTEGGTTERRER